MTKRGLVYVGKYGLHVKQLNISQFKLNDLKISYLVSSKSETILVRPTLIVAV